MDRGVESRSAGRWAMRGQTGRRGLEAEAWGGGHPADSVEQPALGVAPRPSGLDFQPSRPSWHSFQAQNVISVRGSGPRNKGGHDVTSCLGRNSASNKRDLGMPPGCKMFFPFHSPWYFRLSIMPFPCCMLNVHVALAAMEAQRSIIERASQAAAADWRRQPHPAGESFSFAVCHQQDSHPGAHDADKLDANWTLFGACKTPFSFSMAPLHL